MKVSTEIDNNFGYEKITQLVDNIPLRVHLRLRFRLTTFSETVASSLKERKKNKLYISKHVPVCVICTNFRRSLGTSYPYMPKVKK